MRHRSLRGVPPLLAALLLSACATPPMTQPTLAVPAAFRHAQPSAAFSADPVEGFEGTRWKPAQPAERQPRGQWWLVFQDPGLNALVDEAAASNPDVEIAASRVRQARALLGSATAEQVPQIGAQLGVERARPAAADAGFAPGAPIQPHNRHHVRVGASYEVDLFGRVAGSVAAARSDAASAEANYRSVLLVLQADVAQRYFQLRMLGAEIEVMERTIALREQSVNVIQRRFDTGDVSELDLSRARVELATARVEAMALRRERARAEHALAVLLGRPASTSPAVAGPLPPEGGLPAIPAGLPSALLERRPDIAAAQHAMEAAHARIGVARSALFPAVMIGAEGGGASTHFSDVFRWSSRSWVLSLITSMPLLDGGRRRADIERSQALLEESVGSYRHRVLAAFADVEDHLAGLRVLAHQAEQIDAALASAKRSADLAQKLYDAGRSGYLELLEAQRDLTAVERTAVQLRGDRAMTTVALIRALGGGW